MKRRVLLYIFLLFYPILSYSQGPELVTNGTFTNSEGWICSSSSWSISNGVANYNNSSIGSLRQNASNMTENLKPGRKYTLSFEIVRGTGDISFLSTSYQQYVINKTYTIGKHFVEFETPSYIGDGGIIFHAYSYGSFSIDNITLVENAIVGDDPYYVHPDGNDAASGDINNPWRTWQKAFNIAEPGDTIYFRGGVYYQNPPSINPPLGRGKSGENNNWIYYLNYPGEKPILDLSNYVELYSTSWNGLGISYATYLYFKGLTVRNAKQDRDGVAVRGVEAFACSNLSFINFTVHDIDGRGFGFFGGFGRSNIDPLIPDVPYDTTMFINCDSYNNCDRLCSDNSGCDEPGETTKGGLGDGFKYNNEPGAYVLFKGCRAWNCSDDGFDAGGRSFNDIDSCWAINIGSVDGLSGDGYGFKISGNSLVYIPTLTRRVTNSIATYVRRQGFGFNVGSSRYLPYSHIYNNTSYKNQYGFDIAGSYLGDLNPINVKNNVSYKNSSNDIVASLPAIIQQNSWNNPPNVVVTDSDFITTDTTGMTGNATRKLDGSLPDVNFLKLLPSSDLIDAGIEVGLTYYGDAPDLGYSEYIEELTTSTIPNYEYSVIHDISPTRIELYYNLLLADIVPAITSFKVLINSVESTLSSVAISGNKVLLTLLNPAQYGDVVTVSYFKPGSNPLQTPTGSQAASFNSQPVTNNCSAPINIPPVISIASPTKSKSFVAPATITIDAIASDYDGSIAKVEFYQGSVKLGERTTAPYTYTWKDVPQGTYSLIATATDNKNLQTSSEPVIVIVEKSSNNANQLPVVTITSERKDNKYKKKDKIIISAQAADPDGTISKVEFKTGDVILAELRAMPYTYTWDAIDTGTYVITAIATDNLGATSAAVSIELTIGFPDNANFKIKNLFPNPNDGHFTIELDDSSTESDINSILIVNMMGQIVYSEKVPYYSNMPLHFNMSNLAAGPYVIMLKNQAKIISARSFIKK